LTLSASQQSFNSLNFESFLRRKISMNKLLDEFSTIALAEFDAETRFRARAALGCREEGLRLLDVLDRES
jgi:hypothetical protein